MVREPKNWLIAGVLASRRFRCTVASCMNHTSDSWQPLPDHTHPGWLDVESIRSGCYRFTTGQPMASRDRDILPFRPIATKEAPRPGKRKARLRTICTADDIRPNRKRQKEMIARLLPALAEIMHLPPWEFLDTWDDKYIYIAIHGVIAYAIARRTNEIFVAPRGMVDKNQPCGILP